ncbi:toxin Cry1Ac domain D-VI-related protein [Pediococcus acidilactici]
MKYTKYTLLAMSALALGTVGTKAPHLASANQSVVATDKAHTADITAAANAVSDLFANGTHTKLAKGVTVKKIAAAEKLVAKIPTSNPNYARLHKLCNQAKELLGITDNKDVKAATKAVDALFADKEHTKLATGVTEEKVASAQELVAKISTTPNYNNLRSLCITANNLLKNSIKDDVATTAKTVGALFANGTHTKLAAGVTAEKIAAAEKLVAKIPTSNPNYARLHNLCAKAKELLDDSNNNNNGNDGNDSNNNNDIKAATQAVNALFTDGTHTKLAVGVTAEKIAAAQKLVEKNVPQSNSNYQKLMQLCRKAKTLLDKESTESKIKDATDAVYALFADPYQNTLADSTNSAKIKAAKELVKTNVPITDYRFNTLWKLCLKAERLINKSDIIRPASSEGEQKAIDAIKALFSDGTYTKLSDQANTAMLKKAHDLFVKYVKVDNSNYLVLYNLYKKAENLLSRSDDLRPAGSQEEQAVIDAVNALFTDNTHTKLAAGVDRDKINEVKDMITKYLTFDNPNTMILYKLCVKALELLP